jgi:predicted ATPase
VLSRRRLSQTAITPTQKIAVAEVRRLVQETRNFQPRESFDALALEDALVLEMREKGVSEFLRSMLKSWKAFDSSSSPRGVILVGPRNSGKRLALEQGLQGCEQDTLLRLHFSDFAHEARERLVMFRRDRTLRLRDPVPYLVNQLVKSKIAGGDGVRLLVLEDMDVFTLANAWFMRRLFLGLFGHGVGVLITTQRPPSHWYHSGVNAPKLRPFIDLATSRCNVVRVDPRSAPGGQAAASYAMESDAGDAGVRKT